MAKHDEDEDDLEGEKWEWKTLEFHTTDLVGVDSINGSFNYRNKQGYYLTLNKVVQKNISPYGEY